MTYAVKRYQGYQPWGVTNPWVFANLAQPQRRRVPSYYVWQTHPPMRGMHPLGQAESADTRARRMEIYSLIGLTLTGIMVYRTLRARPVSRNRRRRS